MIEKIAIFCKNFIDWAKSERCFIKYFIDAFELTNRNFLLLTFLLLFVFAISMYIIIAESHNANHLITLLITILTTAAFASGFFYSIKKSIDLQYNSISETLPEERIKNTLTIGLFNTGIGKHYLGFLGIIILFFILGSLVVIGTFFAANTFVCDINKLGIDIQDFFIILSNPNLIEQVLTNLDKHQQVLFRDWNRMFLISTQLFTFLLLFWIPEKLYAKRNFFISLFTSIKKLITDLPNSICIYLTIVLLNYILVIVTVLVSFNSLISFLVSLIQFYLLIYDFYAIFLYYRAKYIEPYDR